MRAAAGLLSSARSLDGLSSLLVAARLTDALIPLDQPALDALGVVDAQDVRMGAGEGEIRVLAIRLAGANATRETVQRLTSRLASRAPHVAWIVGAVDAPGERASLVAWSGTARSRRIAAFAWEPDAVVDSDAETLCAVHAASQSDVGLRHSRYLEVLGRDSLTRRFFRALESQVTALAASAPARHRVAAKTVSLLYVSRLLFLSFLEAKGWLNGERAFLANRYDECMRAGGGFHRRVLLPLFFGTLNTPTRRRARAARAFGSIPFLNGGLFSRTPLEREVRGWQLPDERLGALFQQVFHRFRFVAREDSASWSEASVDPEMLGRAFESLMGNADRKAAGVYFTPHPLVARVADEALDACRDVPRRALRVLDPACGSGAFLVYALERIAAERIAAGERGSVAEIRRDVLARSIFGVDRDPTAVWLCELRLWLSVVIELDETDPARVPPLPNLDRNIRVGDALGAAPFAHHGIPAPRRTAALRARYVRANGARKASLARALDREERRRTVERLDREIGVLAHARREQLAAMRSRDLFGKRTHAISASDIRRTRTQLRLARAERTRVARGGALPFAFSVMFAEAQAGGGFDAVIGNPPWVRLHRIPQALRATYRESFEVYRAASWTSGARKARASAGFASQVDLSALFVERSLALLRGGGVMSLLLPVKLWQSLGGGGVRRLLLERAALLRVEDLTGTRHAFEAAVYPSMVVARAGRSATGEMTLARHDADGFREWRQVVAELPFEDSPGAPWLLLTPPARRAFRRLVKAGIPLADSGFGAPRLGVKSGCNAAFVVRVLDATASAVVVEDADGERGKVEGELLRPVLRGDGLAAWKAASGDDRILWTHDARGPLSRLPPLARAWLGRRYGALASRTDARHARRWWSLYRTDAANSTRPRVVWSDFGRRPRALVVPAGDPIVPLNTCYVLPCAEDLDAWALAALLNSRLAAAWLNVIAECARGGYRRYLGWTVGQLPIPSPWIAVRARLAGVGQAAAGGHATEDDLLDAVLRAYGLEHSAMQDLLDTCSA